MSYFILTDTSANLPTPVCEEWELERMPFAYILDGKEYTCMDTENFDDKEYYGKLRSGVRATTSMVAQEAYYEAMTRRAANGDGLRLRHLLRLGALDQRGHTHAAHIG